MSQALAFKIPHGILWTLTPDVEGVTLSLNLSGGEDYSELGSAFVGAALMIWKAKTATSGEDAHPAEGER